MASSRGIFRNVNILREINATTSTQIIDVYQPGFLNSEDVVNNARYSGFITSLRLTIDISSINPMNILESEILASDETIANNNKETFNNNAKKCLSFFMKTANTPLIKIADAFLFNQRPYYYLDLINYFTSAGTFDVAPDATIACQATDVGYGLLQGNDRIILLGCVVEESPYSEPVTQSFFPNTATATAQVPITSNNSMIIYNTITGSPTLIVGINNQRKGITFYNQSSYIVYIDTENTVSADSYLIKLPPDSFYESSYPAYTGSYYGRTEGADVSINIREFS